MDDVMKGLGAAVGSVAMVLFIIAGGGTFKQVLLDNDIGFWMFKEYYNVSIQQTFQIWTVTESTVAVVGLVGVLLFSALLPAQAKTVAELPRICYVNSYHEGYASSDFLEMEVMCP